MHDTLPLLVQTDFPLIYRNTLDTVQINLGYLCNLSCSHCHVNAGPKRTELMDKNTIDLILTFVDQHNIKTLDLTGGAPEVNPYFDYLVIQVKKRGLNVIDRCNLVILQEPGYEWLPKFLADNQVDVVASLPCYLEDNVDKQRGKGTFNASLRALKILNVLGYGLADSTLELNLVFNPQGPTLPPNQTDLEQAYKQHLLQDYGIVFNNLFVLTNLPIQRFGSMLISKGLFDNYMKLLKDHHRDKNLVHVMCRNTLSIDWQGFVYDCDFNQMLQLPPGDAKVKRHLSALLNASLQGQAIRVGDHCYGCTAGQGSSCGGALAGL